MRQLILDTETTGLPVTSGHRIIEIGIVEIIERKFTGNDFQTYLNPERVIDPVTIPIHGIKDDFVSDKPKFAEILSDFIEYIQGSEVIMHNAPFDTSFVNKELELLGYEDRLENICQITDSLPIAKRKHPGQRNSLDALMKRYDIDSSKRELHGALIDAKLTAQVYLFLTGGQVGFFTKDEEGSQMGNASNENIDYSKRKIIHVNASENQKKSHKVHMDNLSKTSNKKLIW